MAGTVRPAYGGEAVFDGVMMRGTTSWSLAVRLPTGEIHVDVHPIPRWTTAARRIPVVRGVFALAASVVLGTRALQDSIAYRSAEKKPASIKERVLTVASALVIVGLFLWVPLFVAKLLVSSSHSLAFSTLEAVLRFAMLLGYISLLGLAKDVRKVFSYHGAEHQAISAREAGEEMTPENVIRFSRQHPRCGTAFLLLILVFGTIAHALVGDHDTGVLAATRVVLLPLVTGLTYEFLRVTSKYLDTAWARMLALPGLTLQRLTTRQSSIDQVEVAIAALEAVVAADERAAAGTAVA